MENRNCGEHDSSNNPPVVMDKNAQGCGDRNLQSGDIDNTYVILSSSEMTEKELREDSKEQGVQSEATGVLEEELREDFRERKGEATQILDKELTEVSREQNVHSETIQALDEKIKKDCQVQNLTCKLDHLMNEGDMECSKQSGSRITKMLGERQQELGEQSEITMLDKRQKECGKEIGFSHLLNYKHESSDQSGMTQMLDMKQQEGSNEIGFSPLLTERQQENNDQSFHSRLTQMLDDINQEYSELNFQNRITRLVNEGKQEYNEQNLQSKLNQMLQDKRQECNEQKWQSGLHYKRQEYKEENWHSRLNQTLRDKREECSEQNWQGKVNQMLYDIRQECNEQTPQSNLTQTYVNKQERSMQSGFTRLFDKINIESSKQNDNTRDGSNAQNLLGGFTDMLNELRQEFCYKNRQNIPTRVIEKRQSGREQNWQKGLDTPNERLGCLLMSSRHSDLKLNFRDKNAFFKVHKLVLAMTSPVFEAKLFSSDVIIQELTLTDNPDDSFRWLLQYMYTGCTKLPSANICLQVTHLAVKYQIDALFTVCARYLDKVLCKDNLLDIYNAAVAIDNKRLLHACRMRLVTYSREVLSSQKLGDLSRDALKHMLKEGIISSGTAIFRIILSWGKAQLLKQKREPTKVALRQEINDFLPLVNLSTMSVEDIANHIIPSAIFTSEEATTFLMSVKKSKAVQPFMEWCREI
nr:uncharacterized protein LOC123761027 [Procambarus clarkii]XP_045602802.1 uncharacterized protein LOC123761027 [Procambarus clarkii]